MTTKFAPFFDRVRESKDKHNFKLTGNRLLVEVLPPEEMKTSGGIVIATDLSGYKTSTQENRPLIAQILYVGTHYWDQEAGELKEGAQYSPGQIVWITKHPVFLSEFPGLGSTEQKLAFITDDPSDVHAVWPSMDAYNEYKKAVQLGK